MSDSQTARILACLCRMKHALAAALLLAATPALAGEAKLIGFDDAAAFFPSALGKQIDVRFSDAFTAAHFGKADFDGLILSELPDGKACFFGRDQGLDPDEAKLKDIARADQGDVCVPASEVSVRFTPQEVAGAPPSPFYTTDKEHCGWSWKTGAGIGVWTEDCKFDTGTWAVSYDAKNDLFSLSVDGGDPFPVLRQFRKKPQEGPEALLPAFRKAGLIPGDTECQFAPSTEQKGPAGWSFWEIAPVGKRKEAFDAQPQDEIPEPPCGDVGYAVDYIGFFMISDAHPDRVLYVNLGQDGTMIDPFSIALF